MGFFRNTLYWYQTLDTNPVRLQALEAKTTEAVEWLLGHDLISNEAIDLLITPFGAATAFTGLLPSTAVQFADLLANHHERLEDAFEDAIPGLIHAAVSCEEFTGEKPTRYLTYQPREYESVSFLRGFDLLFHLDATNLQVAQCAHAVLLFADGEQERKISHRTKV
jgi:helicase